MASPSGIIPSVRDLIVNADRKAAAEHAVVIPPVPKDRSASSSERDALETALLRAWTILKQERESDLNLSQDDHYCAAEHYLFARWFVFEHWFANNLNFKLVISMYDGIKILLAAVGKSDWIKRGKFPPTMPSRLALSSSFDGADQGQYFNDLVKGRLMLLSTKKADMCLWNQRACPRYPF